MVNINHPNTVNRTKRSSNTIQINISGGVRQRSKLSRINCAQPVIVYVVFSCKINVDVRNLYHGNTLRRSQQWHVHGPKCCCHQCEQRLILTRNRPSTKTRSAFSIEPDMGNRFRSRVYLIGTRFCNFKTIHNVLSVTSVHQKVMVAMIMTLTLDVLTFVSRHFILFLVLTQNVVRTVEGLNSHVSISSRTTVLILLN